jgi:hypothetical protein
MEHRDDETQDSEDETASAADSERASPSAVPSKSESKAGKAPRAGRSSADRRDGGREDRKQSSNGAPPKRSPTVAIVAAVAALAAGVAVGWFGHIAQAKAKLRAESGPAAAGSSGPCDNWQQQICATSGERSATCQQARGATELLTPGTCETALATVPATLAKIKVARESCDTLVGKLCKDLPKDSTACSMVKERTPSFPAERCKGMLAQYDQVLAELKMLDSQGGLQQGSPHGSPPGMPPQGAPHP